MLTTSSVGFGSVGGGIRAINLRTACLLPAFLVSSPCTAAHLHWRQNTWLPTLAHATFYLDVLPSPYYRFGNTGGMQVPSVNALLRTPRISHSAVRQRLLDITLKNVLPPSTIRTHTLLAFAALHHVPIHAVALLRRILVGSAKFLYHLPACIVPQFSSPRCHSHY